MLKNHFKGICMRLGGKEVVGLDKKMDSFGPSGTLKDVNSPRIQKIEDNTKIPIRVMPGSIRVAIVLPQGSVKRPARLFRVSSKITVRELAAALGIHFKVSTKWKIYGSIDRKKYPTSILDDKDQIESYDINNSPQARLYFYPEMRI